MLAHTVATVQPRTQEALRLTKVGHCHTTDLATPAHPMGQVRAAKMHSLGLYGIGFESPAPKEPAADELAGTGRSGPGISAGVLGSMRA